MSLETKKIQIDTITFLNVYRLIFALDGYELDCDTKELIKNLEVALNAKIDAMQRHYSYTQSKVALTEKDREKARQKYLEMAGIHKDWRYDKDLQKE